MLTSRWTRVLGLVTVCWLAIALVIRAIDDPERVRGAPAQDPGAVVFAGDFETGISPPWEGVQACPGEGGSSFVRVPSPQSHGGYAGEATVRGPCGFGSQRAEVLGAHVYTRGTERYFGHSVLFPPGFPAEQAGWCVTMQIHTSRRGSTGEPSALSLNCRGESSDATLIRAQSNPGCAWRTDLVRDVWLHFVWRVRFGSDDGNWDLWYRPDTATSYTHVVDGCRSNALLGPDDAGYWKLGLYRGSANRDAVSVYHDDAKVGTTFGAVAP